ncbi:Hsp33 family molecular chaperone HslO [Aurantiacibacter flavus]|uniref:Hsp33 family molecular chaperone HslO n=1 Tax=Aurantiacibacter flavus TaxID=3145232 RepID=A0ABV0CXD4_9SPHN
MTDTTAAQVETSFDTVLRFILPDRDCRGRLVRLGPVLDEILSAHDYPAPVKHCLAEALVLTALMGSMLKDEQDQMTIQARSEEGLIRLLVCDYRDGALRGYAEVAPDVPAQVGANPRLGTLFGKGHLAVTFDLASTGQRYQGIVPLEGENLSHAIEAYFAQSEQLPTRVRTAMAFAHDGGIAGGMLVQHLADGEEGRERLHVRFDHPEWEHVSILADTISHGELVDQALSMEALVWRLFHEERELRTDGLTTLRKGCRCSIEHYAAILSRFGKEERAEMTNDEGDIVVDCAFCSREFAIPAMSDEVS